MSAPKSFLLGFWMLLHCFASTAATPPNIILIITDDQGYGDLGFHGNPVLKTPHLDRLAEESVILERFYVSPVCAPTRASLLTGRWNYRTGVVDTYIGRAMMDSEEVTLAEMLGKAGYRTGIFGKWHLGDNYPMRPQDQGFQESLVHRGGGIGQPADPPGNLYTNPTLSRNGKDIQASGYCSDVFTDGAIEFIRDHRDQPFFAYLAFNCPHTPLQVPEEAEAPYRALDMTLEMFPRFGHEVAGKFNAEETAKIYGMVSNIDDNIGRLMAALDDAGLRENTIVMFLTDNGPQQPRYNGGLKGLKTSVYDGGIRVPAFIRYPSKFAAGVRIDRPLAHIDVVPTFLDLCGAPVDSDLPLDGRSFRNLMENPSSGWPDRTLFFQWHRGDVPQPFRACTAIGPRYKMVQAAGIQEGQSYEEKFELYDLIEDPYESNDLSEEKPDILDGMKAEYKTWFEEVSASRGYDPPRIVLGSDQENPVVLTRQDWRGPKAGWTKESIGYWETTVHREGYYAVELMFDSDLGAETARLVLGASTLETPIPKGADRVRIEKVTLNQGDLRLEPTLQSADGKTLGVRYATVFSPPTTQ